MEKTKNNNAFVNIVKQMLSSNVEYDKIAKSKLYSKIDKISKIAEREWLLEKLVNDTLK